MRAKPDAQLTSRRHRSCGEVVPVTRLDHGGGTQRGRRAAQLSTCHSTGRRGPRRRRAVGGGKSAMLIFARRPVHRLNLRQGTSSACGSCRRSARHTTKSRARYARRVSVFGFHMRSGHALLSQSGVSARLLGIFQPAAALSSRKSVRFPEGQPAWATVPGPAVKR